MGTRDVQRGRDLCAAGRWSDASAALEAADRAAPLAAADVELLATSAYMLGRGGDYLRLLERAHGGHARGGRPRRAARCAFWVGTELLIRGEAGRAAGWLARAERILDAGAGPCVERGYLLLPQVLRHSAAGDHAAAGTAAAQARRIGERFGDADLVALAVHEQGHALIEGGDPGRGLALLDEAMVAVTAGELSPIVTGLLYCSVIGYCRAAFAHGRAQEWTAALSGWCARQPDMVAFTGACRVHRAEVLQLRGEWGDALDEARRAVRRAAQAPDRAAAGEALYRQGELHRLQGDLAAAHDDYRGASLAGREPQPGLALLRLAQGRGDAAAAAIRRALGETAGPLARARLLPAHVEIMLGAGEVAQAQAACTELEAIADAHESAMLAAMAAHARGAVRLAGDDAAGALASLRGASSAWRTLDAPLEEARARMLIGRACRALGDDDTAALELEAARAVFARLGARPDAASADALLRPPARAAHGLTPRELEVLRLVAAGHGNRRIASTLVISEHTVARHVQNIMAKLGVSSRTAAGAFAFEHGLV